MVEGTIRGAIGVGLTEERLHLPGRAGHDDLHPRQRAQDRHVPPAVVRHPVRAVVVRGAGADDVAAGALGAEVVPELLAPGPPATTTVGRAESGAERASYSASWSRPSTVRADQPKAANFAPMSPSGRVLEALSTRIAGRWGRPAVAAR